MNETASRKRGSASLKRAAATGVAAFCAALLTATGSTAQASLASEGASGLAQASDTASFNDFDQDGRPDLMAVRKADGHLMFHAGMGTGAFADPVSLGWGWGRMDLVMPGDLTGDGLADLLARDTKTGTLYTYPGDGSGGLGSRVTVGTGWNSMGLIAAAGDVDNDGNLDLYVVRKSDWHLYVYPGLGDGTFGGRLLFDDRYRGWADVDTLTMVGSSDPWQGDEFLIRQTSGEYLLVPRSRLDLSGNTSVLDGSLGQGTAERYSQVAGIGDADGDGHPDVAAIDSRTGQLELHTVKVSEDHGSASALRDPEVIGTGWGGMRLASPDTDRTYDYDGNAVQDIIVRGTDGEVVPHQPEGNNSWWGADSWGTGFKSMTLLETAGDSTGDGFSDLLARDASGNLYVYPGDGYTVGKTARVLVGGGWNSMSAIVSGQDFNGDGKSDIVARLKSTGDLYFYPGIGGGKYGARVKIGTGWNGMREITAVGDLDHDGHADLIAIRTSNDCLYFYGGRGNGTHRSSVQMGCGFAGIQDLASVGDATRDGFADWVARRKSDGRTYMYHGDGKGDFKSVGVLTTDWTWVNMIA
jgi:hypothetical protein